MTLLEDRGPDWRRARRDRRMLVRRLPPALGELLTVVRRDDAGDELADGILKDAGAAARGAGPSAVRHVEEAIGDSWSYVSPVAEREALRRLAGNDTYRSQVRARVRATLRAQHIVKVEPATTGIMVPEGLGSAPRLENGVLAVESDIGLGTASVLEAEPEAWNHWVAAAILRAWSPESINGAAALRVLVVGALGGGFARTVTAIDSRVPTVAVTETDWVLRAPTNLPCVEGRGLDEAMRFDAAVVVLPAPATSEAAGQRFIYDNKAEFDLGRLGRTRWVHEVVAPLFVVASLLVSGGRAYVLVPQGVRTGRGYTDGPELLDGVLAKVGPVGFTVEGRYETIEIAPVAQPFVGTNRPSKTTLVLRKVAP